MELHREREIMNQHYFRENKKTDKDRTANRGIFFTRMHFFLFIEQEKEGKGEKEV